MPITRSAPQPGVAVLTIAAPGGIDALDTVFVAGFAQAVDAALADADVAGIVLTFDGAQDAPAANGVADAVAALGAQADPERRRRAALARVGALQAALRKLETGGKPAAAALTATARGTAFEIVLACHRRVVADDPALRLGCAGVRGLRIPDAGATQRLVRMIGAMAALPLLLEGAPLTAAEAQRAKLVDEVAPADTVVARAVAWVQGAAAADAQRPWDTKTFRLPGADPRTHHGGGQFAVANALQRKRTGGRSPAADAVQMLAYQACLVLMDTGLRLESKYAARLLLEAGQPGA